MEWLRERLNAPVYAVFFFASVAWNYSMLYALFFEDKVTFADSRYAYARTFAHHFPFEAKYSIINTVLDLIALFGVPVVMTYVAIWWLPYLHGLAHRRSLQFHFNRKGEFDRQRNAYEKLQSQRLQELRNVVIEQREATQEIVAEKEAQQEAAQALEGENDWEKEFERLRRDPNEYGKLSLLRDHAYSGYALSAPDRQRLSFFHLMGLFEFTERLSHLTLTAKGKYFIKRFLEEPRG